MRYLTEQELYHHGILGQKWGVRRFQNQDGSYTAAGKARYDIGEDGKRSVKSYALEYKDRARNKSRYARIKRNQNLDTMSDEELSRLATRESQKSFIRSKQKEEGASWLKETAKQAGRNFITNAAGSIGSELGRAIVSVPIKLLGFAGKTAVDAGKGYLKTVTSMSKDILLDEWQSSGNERRDVAKAEFEIVKANQDPAIRQMLFEDWKRTYHPGY